MIISESYNRNVFTINYLYHRTISIHGKHVKIVEGTELSQTVNVF